MAENETITITFLKVYIYKVYTVVLKYILYQVIHILYRQRSSQVLLC